MFDIKTVQQSWVSYRRAGCRTADHLLIRLPYILLQHVLIVVRVFIAYIIPDQAKWLKIALARDAYRLKTRALAQEQQQVRVGVFRNVICNHLSLSGLFVI